MTTISTLPTAPSRADPSTFVARSDALLGALDGFVSQTNLVAGEVNTAAATATTQAELATTNGAAQVALATTQAGLATTNGAAQVALATTQANNAATSATAAAGSALVAGALAWVSGTTYAVGDARYSPINMQTYRRTIAGAGTTDPSLDATNWTAAIASLPSQTGNAGKFVTTNGTAASWADVPLPGLVFISTATASGVASVDITGLSAAYSTYMLVCTRVIPVADGSFLSLRTSTNGGVTFDSGASDYQGSQTGTDFAGTSLAANSTAAQIRLCNIPQSSSANNNGCSAILYIHKPSSTSYCRISWSATSL